MIIYPNGKKNKTPRTKLRIKQVVGRMEAEIMLRALEEIREMGYNSQASRATECVLACVRVAEAAIGEVEERNK